jgi:hypothetical protein
MNILIMDIDSGECILDVSLETWNPYDENDIQRLNDRIESSFLEYGETCVNAVEFNGYNDTTYQTFELTGG